MKEHIKSILMVHVNEFTTSLREAAEDLYDETVEPLERHVKEAEKKITELESELESMTKSYVSSRNTISSLLQELSKYNP